MKPEVVSVLRKIGWDAVSRCHPFFVTKLTSNFEEVLPNNEKDARTEAETVKIALKLTFDLLKAIDALPETSRKNITLASVSMEEMLSALHSSEQFQPNEILDEVQSTLARLIVGLEATQARMKLLAGEPKRGNPKNLRPYSVALAAAKVYYVGRDDDPKAFNNSATGRLGGLFGQTVEELFDVMGLGFEALAPCKEAIESLKSLPDEELSELKMMKEGATGQNVKLVFL